MLFKYFFSIFFFALSYSDSVPDPDSFLVIIWWHITLFNGNLGRKPVLSLTENKIRSWSLLGDL